MKVYVPLALGGVILLGAIVIMFMSGSKPPAHSSESGTATAESVATANKPPAPESAPQPVVSPKPQELSTGTKAPPPKPTPAPPPPATSAPPPPEPVTAPPPPALVANPAPRPTPPAPTTAVSYGPWEEPFNGKNLDGWSSMKGSKWEVVDGCLIDVESPRGAMIQTTDESFGNLELKFKFWTDKAPNAEAHIRSYGVVFDFDMEQRKWHDITISANGASISATLDGAPNPPNGEGEGNASAGFISFYVHKGGILKIKDLKVRRVLSK
jgi:hypothetical protein